jgi:hypothetical protein
MSDETPYQIAPQVAALQAERENAVAYGNETRVAQIDRQLADLGVKAKAAEERKAASDDAKQAAPKGRRSKESAQTTEGSSEA